LGPTPQSPIPNPQSPIPIINSIIFQTNKKLNLLIILSINYSTIIIFDIMNNYIFFDFKHCYLNFFACYLFLKYLLPPVFEPLSVILLNFMFPVPGPGIFFFCVGVNGICLPSIKLFIFCWLIILLLLL